MEKELIASAFYFYTRIEKRGLPLETSKALINSYYGKTDRGTADSLLEKCKALLPFWIENDSLVQIYKRYFNSLLKKELSLGECFSPFVLINCQESFERLIFHRRRREARALLEDLFGNLEVEDLFSIRDREDLFRELYRRIPLSFPHKLYLSTHVAFLISPNDFPPLTPSTGGYLGIRSIESYLRFREYLKDAGHRPIEVFALLHLVSEEVPSKRRGIEGILCLDRERELLLQAVDYWNRGRFYEAHEVLEEIWKRVSGKEKKNCLQGVIRFAIALYHLRQGEKIKALKVLRKALPQIEGCGGNVMLNISELKDYGKTLIYNLQNDAEPPPTLRLRMI